MGIDNNVLQEYMYNQRRMAYPTKRPMLCEPSLDSINYIRQRRVFDFHQRITTGEIFPDYELEREFQEKLAEYNRESLQADIEYIVETALYIIIDTMEYRGIDNPDIKGRINILTGKGKRGFIYQRHMIDDARRPLDEFIKENGLEILYDVSKKKLKELHDELCRFNNSKKYKILRCRILGHEFDEDEHSFGMRVCKYCDKWEDEIQKKP